MHIYVYICSSHRYTRLYLLSESNLFIDRSLSFTMLKYRRHRFHPGSSCNTHEIGRRIGQTWESSEFGKCSDMFDAHGRRCRIHFARPRKTFSIGFILHGRQCPQSRGRWTCRCCANFLARNSEAVPPENLSSGRCVDFGEPRIFL